MPRAQALVMAEYEEAFEKPQYGFNAGRGSGFVRAGGESTSMVMAYEQVYLYSLKVVDRSIHPLDLLGDHQQVQQL
jgi:hypothetical protein